MLSKTDEAKHCGNVEAICRLAPARRPDHSLAEDCQHGSRKARSAKPLRHLAFGSHPPLVYRAAQHLSRRLRPVFARSLPLGDAQAMAGCTQSAPHATGTSQPDAVGCSRPGAATGVQRKRTSESHTGRAVASVRQRGRIIRDGFAA